MQDLAERWKAEKEKMMAAVKPVAGPAAMAVDSGPAEEEEFVWHTPKAMDQVRRLDEDARQRAPTLVSARGLLDSARICAIRGREQEHKEILSFCRKALTSSPDAESRQCHLLVPLR